MSRVSRTNVKFPTLRTRRILSSEPTNEASKKKFTASKCLSAPTKDGPEPHAGLTLRIFVRNVGRKPSLCAGPVAAICEPLHLAIYASASRCRDHQRREA